MIQYDFVSHWLNAYTKWSLALKRTWGENSPQKHILFGNVSQLSCHLSDSRLWGSLSNLVYIVVSPHRFWVLLSIQMTVSLQGMSSANERQCYTVMSSLICWAHTQNDPLKIEVNGALSWKMWGHHLFLMGHHSNASDCGYRFCSHHWAHAL